jgi:hypothetical protein
MCSGGDKGGEKNSETKFGENLVQFLFLEFE